jgi:superfamily II DNA or RNA helicase
MTRNEVHQEAVESWLNSGKRSTLQISTGVGKTFIFLHCLHQMPKNEGLHLFLAEVTDREKDLESDIIKFDKMFGTTTRYHYNLVFKTYQAVYKTEGNHYGLVCADEIHNMLSPVYSKFVFNNTFDGILGLSATIDHTTKYEIDGRYVTKGDLLNRIAPISYTYSILDAKNDGIGRMLNLYIINQELDPTEKTVKAGSVKNSFYQTEKTAYDYWHKEHQKAWFLLDPAMKDLKIRITATKRSNLLFNLPSKIKTIFKLLEVIKGQTIIFGNSIDSLLKITSNVISSRYSDDQNKAIRDHFDKGLISIIGSFKKLRQGANLNNLDNCIIMSYYSSEGHIVQQLGRMRLNGNKHGNAFILRTKDTQECVWFEKMMSNLKEFNIIECNDIEDCIIKYKLNNEIK